jgi:hypothetical protein
MNSNNSQIQVGQLLKDSFVYTPPIYLTLLVFFFPSLIISLLLLGMTPGAAVLTSIINLLGIVPFVTGAAIFYVYQTLTNRGATIPDSMQAAGERFAQLVFLTFILFVLLIAGFILLVVPGIYLSIRLSFVYYAVMIENRSTFDAFNRSWRLTQGHWWKIFWAFLVLFFAIFIPAFIVLIIFTVIDPSGADIGGSLLSFLVSPFISVYYVLLFMSFVNLVEDNGDVYKS